jgi:hypothetical protein
MELTSRHQSGAKNFGVAPKCLENLRSTPGLNKPNFVNNDG